MPQQSSNQRSEEAGVSGDGGPRQIGSIVKIGGSLLDLPDLPERVRELLGRFDQPVALLVGGGPAADVVREWSAVFRLDESVAHWLAIDSLNLTARLLRELLNRPCTDKTSQSKATVVETWQDAVQASSRGQVPVLGVRGILRSMKSGAGVAIPESWATTSDSIAAAIAIRFGVRQLVLCKSIDVPEDGSLSSADADSPVDDWFPQLTPRLQRVLWCNLRSSSLEFRHWRPC